MALTHNTSIVRNGLVLLLDAANSKSYPGSGTVWTDLSGRGNSGTLSSVDYSTATSTLLFNASEDTVTIPHSSTLNFSRVFTVSAWVKVNSFSTAAIYNVLSKKPSYNNTQKGWSCQYDYRTTGILQYRNNNGTVLNDHTPTASVNNTAIFNQTSTFVNSAWVISGSSVTFYINGQLNSSVSVTYTDTDTTSTVYIGKTVGSPGDPALLMNLGVISVYNRALSVAEIQQNFQALRDRYGI